MAPDATHPLFDKHIATLRRAVAAAENRVRWSPFPETPAWRGEQAIEDGREAFDAYRDASFYLDQPGVVGRVGTERSPYGLPLNINYPQCSGDTLIVAAGNGMSSWVAAGPDARTGVCLEILDRLHGYGLEITHAVMHTTGQPFTFAYQHSLVAALDRGLEALAAAYREMKQVPARTILERAQGKHAAIKVENRYTIAPRGVALVVSSANDPTWLSWPGVFASLVTGNPVIVQTQSDAVLPLAMTVAVARQIIKEAGFDPNLVSLLVDEAGSSSATVIGLRPEIRIIDCAGEAATANWLSENAHHAAVFSLKRGVNCVVVDSVSDYKGMLRNLAFGLCLNSGQLDSAPRLILVSREGVRAPGGTIPAEQFGRDLAFTIGKLLESVPRAVEVLGAIRDPRLIGEIEMLRDTRENHGDVILRDLSRLDHPQWPAASIATPLLLKAALTEANEFLDGLRGPVAFVAETGTVAEALAGVERIMRDKGALNFSVYTDSAPLQDLAGAAAARVGVALNLNLTGNLLAAQVEAFSDFYATGENPSASCSLVDAAFVARRFFVMQTRRQLG